MFNDIYNKINVSLYYNTFNGKTPYLSEKSTA